MNQEVKDDGKEEDLRPEGSGSCRQVQNAKKASPAIKLCLAVAPDERKKNYQERGECRTFGGFMDWQPIMRIAIMGIGVIGLLFVIVRLLFWGKLKDKLFPPKIIYADGLRFCEDMVIRPARLKIQLLGTQLDNESKAWLNLSSLYIRWLDGKDYLPVSDRDCIPLDLHGRLSVEDRQALYDGIWQIAVASADNVAVQVAKEDRQFTLAIMIGIMGGLAAAVLAIMGIVTIFQNKGGV